MSNPLVHAERSAKKWGGTADDYLDIHQWFDATRGHLSDVRHRLVLHNSFGILLAEQVFGPAITNSDNRRVFVRDIGTQHVLEDLGWVPTLAQCLAGTPCEPWMAGAHKLLRTNLNSHEGETLDDGPLHAAGGVCAAGEAAGPDDDGDWRRSDWPTSGPAARLAGSPTPPND